MRILILDNHVHSIAGPERWGDDFDGQSTIGVDMVDAKEVDF